MANKRDGLIWIDKDIPHNLKYYLNNKEYVVENHSTYTIDIPTEGSEREEFDKLAIGSVWIPAGTLLSINEDGITHKAIFPDEIENVIGVVTNNIIKTDTYKVTEAIISHDGFLEVDSKYLDDVFQEGKENILEYAEKGDVIYWFIGREEKEENSSNFNFIEPKNYPGKLTIYTPCGLKNNSSSLPGDNSLNVSYNGLPQIGVISKVNRIDESNSNLEIHLNFSKFNSSIEWSWPGIHNPSFSNPNCGKVESSNSSPIIIKHGLFPNSDSSFNPKCSCVITSLSEHEDENKDISEEIILAPVINHPTGENRRTEVIISSPEDLFIRINGKVSYKFDKG